MLPKCTADKNRAKSMSDECVDEQDYLGVRLVGILADNTGILTEVSKISATYQLQ